MDMSARLATDKQIVVYSFYRDAELRGARLLFNLLGHLKSGEAQVRMSRHLADETRHAWLWTQRIADLGAVPVPVVDGYQRRLGLRTGIPKDVVELLALTVVVEERAQERYRNHLKLPNLDLATREILTAVTADEAWHLSWVEKEMRSIARTEGNEGRAEKALDRFRAIEREVYATLTADELELMRI